MGFAHAKRKFAMTQGNLHLVEGTFMDKTKALGATLSTIDGEGSIMQLGRNESTGLGVLEAIEPEAELIALAEQVDLAEKAFLDSTILRTDPRILLDARADMHALANPLVAGEFVGVPLRTHDGFNLGTFCVIDSEPHPVAESQIARLKALASIVMDQMELRLSARRAIADLSRMVDELSRTVDEKEAALRRAELMAKEIDHRVMNSLQLVSGLLDMQSRGVGSSETAEQLALASSRVATIAQVHRHIYQSDGVRQGELQGLPRTPLRRTFPYAAVSGERCHCRRQ